MRAGLDSEARSLPAAAHGRARARPRLGFLGTGWIGRSRLEAIAQSGYAAVVALGDSDRGSVAQAQSIAPQARPCDDLDALLGCELDGLVIATPSALHAQQAIAALGSGVAVFCQKPLARTGVEARAVIDAAREADLLLGVDLSYRWTEAARAVRALVEGGRLGRIHAVDLVFHNAYGPDKPWFRQAALSGGGCLIDLGTHLIDLALWLLGMPEVHEARACLMAGGRVLRAPAQDVEDYAEASLVIGHGISVRLACSWNLPAGRDAMIGASVYGSEGGATLRNLGGSFYDFTAEHHVRTQTTTLVEPPDAWSGRAAVDWVRRLAAGQGFDPAIDGVAAAADVLDRLYGRG
jgi:predicted dehydrogenase